MDKRISLMSRREVFERFLNWHGILGWDSILRCAVADIYSVNLREKAGA